MLNNDQVAIGLDESHLVLSGGYSHTFILGTGLFPVMKRSQLKRCEDIDGFQMKPIFHPTIYI
jgi:hypothetical protein